MLALLHPSPQARGGIGNNVRLRTGPRPRNGGEASRADPRRRRRRAARRAERPSRIGQDGPRGAPGGRRREGRLQVGMGRVCVCVLSYISEK